MTRQCNVWKQRVRHISITRRRQHSQECNDPHRQCCCITRDLDLWPFGPKINVFSGIIVVRLYVKFVISAASVFEISCRKTETNGGKNSTMWLHCFHWLYSVQLAFVLARIYPFLTFFILFRYMHFCPFLYVLLWYVVLCELRLITLQKSVGCRTAVTKETVVKTTVRDAGGARWSACVQSVRRASSTWWSRLSASVTDARTPVTVPSDWPPAWPECPFTSFTMDRVTSCQAAAPTTV